QRVVHHLGEFLMDEGIVRTGSERVTPEITRPVANEGPLFRRGSEPLFQTIVSFRWTEPHDDIFRSDQRREPGFRAGGKIERGEGALADDYGMSELHGNVLGVGGISTAANGQQTPTATKAACHFLTGERQRLTVGRNVAIGDFIAPEQ